ncbi:hypothetical protein [Alloacidobacterium sp.]|uniref:hypothetical protein n=1 Tax=Alloacidobacterium sp. TaxID=2951999 RepID=UPI002D4B6193|nr:hypothetical protein [Alloacidobacterium sp.]HYK37484.1 hypothetical protein [Alloacidobacterium sp.]
MLLSKGLLGLRTNVATTLRESVDVGGYGCTIALTCSAKLCASARKPTSISFCNRSSSVWPSQSGSKQAPLKQSSQSPPMQAAQGHSQFSSLMQKFPEHCVHAAHLLQY